MHANANAAIPGRSHCACLDGQRKAYDMMVKVPSPIVGTDTRVAKDAIRKRRKVLIVHAPSSHARERLPGGP